MFISLDHIKFKAYCYVPRYPRPSNDTWYEYGSSRSASFVFDIGLYGQQIGRAIMVGKMPCSRRFVKDSGNKIWDKATWHRQGTLRLLEECGRCTSNTILAWISVRFERTATFKCTHTSHAVEAKNGSLICNMVVDSERCLPGLHNCRADG